MRRVSLVIFFGFMVLVASAQDSRSHTVRSGETLYGLARQYGVSVSALAQANGISTRSEIKVGQKMKVPGSGNSASDAAVSGLHQAKKQPAACHVVRKGETLYSVARQYGVGISDLRAWNNLTDLNLKTGQRLVLAKTTAAIGYTPVHVPSTPDTPYRDEDIRAEMAARKDRTAERLYSEPVEKPKELIETARPAPVDNLKVNTANPEDYPEAFNQYAAAGFKILKSRGQASALNAETSGNPYLALFNDAANGAIIRVTNLLNQKTIFVKVLGRVTAADAASETMLKISAGAAEALGADNQRFLVEVASYNKR